MHVLDYEFVFHAGRVRQLTHLDRVLSCYTCSCLEHQAASRAATDKSCFGAGEAGYLFSSFTIQLLYVDHDPCGTGHDL